MNEKFREVDAFMEEQEEEMKKEREYLLSLVEGIILFHPNVSDENIDMKRVLKTLEKFYETKELLSGECVDILLRKDLYERFFNSESGKRFFKENWLTIEKNCPFSKKFIKKNPHYRYVISGYMSNLEGVNIAIETALQYLVNHEKYVVVKMTEKDIEEGE